MFVDAILTIDDLQSDVGLSLQLARALELDNAITSTTNVAASAANNTAHESSSHGRVDGNFGSNSIYSGGTSLASSTRADSWLHDYYNITAALSSTTPSPLPPQPTPSADKPKAPIVLDSDISDSEEDEDSESSDDEYRDNRKVPGKPSHLKVQNKYKQKTPAETQQEMIEKMKERHRAEARMASMRSNGLRLQQHPLSSSSRYHSLQNIPSSTNIMNANPTLPSNYPPPTHRLPNAHSMQELSPRMDDREPMAYPQGGRANPITYSSPPHQTFNRGHYLGTSPSYSEQMVRPLHASREFISDVSLTSHVQYHHKKRPNNEVRVSHQGEKSMLRENVLRKSKSFNSDPHSRRRYIDNDLPPMPTSPTSEPGFDSVRNDQHSHVKQRAQLSPTSHRISSNNSSITDESDTPNLPLTPSDVYDESPQRVKTPLSSDAEPKLTARPVNVVKHRKSESSLRRTQQVCPEEDQDALAMNEDMELKWHYRCYRQQSLYTSFSDYLAATQYQKMMLQHQQQIIYNPYPVPGYQYH
ncbi:hypothetical protein BC943DRAFT_194294 [Umbelopsis sp. AD052]|nr:hypothetical protein BC943DRAFT_194294 [Umbelopsis sp. AD052]